MRCLCSNKAFFLQKEKAMSWIWPISHGFLTSDLDM